MTGAEGVAVAYIQGLVMPRIADMSAGEAEADAQDAYIIAEGAYSTQHGERWLVFAPSCWRWGSLRSLRLVR